VYFHLETVLAYFDQLLGLPQASQTLRYVAALEEKQAKLRHRQLTSTGSLSPALEVVPTAFETLRPRIVQSLYELIEEHIELFP
jgi:hypothetical protein